MLVGPPGCAGPWGSVTLKAGPGVSQRQARRPWKKGQCGKAQFFFFNLGF